MNVLDLAVVAIAVMAVVGGYRLGFVTGATSWAGLIVGVVVATRFLPAVSDRLGGGVPANRLLVGLIFFITLALIGQLLGQLAGLSFRRVLPPGPFRQADRALGAVMGLVGVVVGVWLFLPAISEARGWPAEQAHNSAVAKAVDAIFPNPPGSLQALRRLVGSGVPKVFDALTPAIDTGPPPADSGLAAAVLARVSSATVKVEGAACRAIESGSGFAAGPDVVLTNAHVVAGQQKTTVIRPDGRRFNAVVTAFDPVRDVAVLRVRGLGETPLPMGSGKEGETGAVFGHPGGTPRLIVSPAAIRQKIRAVGRDIYDQRQSSRLIFVLASTLRPGDSGGGLVDRSGTVVGMAFGIAPDRPSTAYALTTEEIRPVLDGAAGRTAGVSTGPCLVES